MDNITKLVPTSKLVNYLASLLALGYNMNSACTFGVQGQRCVVIAFQAYQRWSSSYAGKRRTALTPYTPFTPYTASVCLTGRRSWVRGGARNGTWTK